MGCRHFHYHVLPFGLSTAPCIFTKCRVVEAVALQTWGITVFPYINDWLVVASCPHQLESHIQSVFWFLDCLGLWVNLKKSVLRPTKVLQFIGAKLHSIDQMAYLPNRAGTIQALDQHFLCCPKATCWVHSPSLGTDDIHNLNHSSCQALNVASTVVIYSHHP